MNATVGARAMSLLEESKGARGSIKKTYYNREGREQDDRSRCT